jgi:hypothetical protein
MDARQSMLPLLALAGVLLTGCGPRQPRSSPADSAPPTAGPTPGPDSAPPTHFETSYFLEDGDLFLELPVDSGTLRFRRQA